MTNNINQKEFLNNAGILMAEDLDNLNKEAFLRIERQFEVNALGPL